MSAENKFISPELRDKIEETVKSRQSLEMLLHDVGFEGTKESIAELLHTLLGIMGSRMTLEFIFSSHIAIWEEYRQMIDEDMWRNLAKEGNFNCENYILLSTSIIHRGDKQMGIDFMRDAVEQAHDVKTFSEVADAVHSHLKDNEWAEEILLGAKEHCSDAEHYSKIAEAMMNIAEDEKMSRSLFEEGLEKVKVAHEYIEIATAILRTLKDCSWAEEIFKKHKDVPESGTPIEMLAEEAYQDELKLICDE